MSYACFFLQSSYYHRYKKFRITVIMVQGDFNYSISSHNRENISYFIVSYWSLSWLSQNWCRSYEINILLNYVWFHQFTVLVLVQFWVHMQAQMSNNDIKRAITLKKCQTIRPKKYLGNLLQDWTSARMVVRFSNLGNSSKYLDNIFK